MKKYLMRGGMSPLDTLSPEVVIEKNSIGANSGNLLYAFGVYRTLMTEDVTIDMDYYGVERSFTDADIARINEEYDAYICPLADAFRDAFAGKLLKYANFFNKLTIPVYVIGLGLRSTYEPEFLNGGKYPFNEEAKEFVKAVLNKSAMLGLRGEITGEYLKTLGFREDVDFMPIGCPSMYTFGRSLPQRELKWGADGRLDPATKLSLNMSAITPENVIECMMEQIKRFPDYCVIEQNEAELRMLYAGVNYITKKKDKSTILPLNVNHPLLQEDRYRVFINAQSWFDFLRGMDLSFGSKLHGNVAGVLSGCPTLFVPLDGRMRELVDYHAFPAVPYTEVKGTDTLEDLIAKVDMQGHIKKQAQNFDRYVDFLDGVGIDHIYKEDRNRTDAPVDAIMAQKEYPVVTSILKCDQKEMIRRFNAYNDIQRRTISRMKKEAKQKSSGYEKLLKENSQLRNMTVMKKLEIAIRKRLHG